MSIDVAGLPIVAEVAKAYGLTPEAFVAAFTELAMPHPHTASEMIMCMLSARESKLNPLMREIFFKRTERGEIQGLVKVDGWIKICNSHPQYDGMEFETERTTDGSIISMTCSIWRKDRGRPIKITEFFDECARGGGEVWKTNPNRQMRNRTLSQCARVAFGISGIMEESEFSQWQAQERAKGELTREPLPNTTAVRDDFIPDVPVDDMAQDVPDVPEDEPVAATVVTEATGTKDDEAVVAEFREALAEQATTVALIGELRAVYEDAIDGLSSQAKSEIQDLLLGAILKAHAKAKTKSAKRKAEADALDLLDHLSDAGRRTLEAVFDGRNVEAE